MRGADVQLRFGKAVKTARQSFGYSQEMFTSELGMHRTQLGHIEQGLKDCRLSTIVRIASALDLTVSELLADVHTKSKTGR